MGLGSKSMQTVVLISSNITGWINAIKEIKINLFLIRNNNSHLVGVVVNHHESLDIKLTMMLKRPENVWIQSAGGSVEGRCEKSTFEASFGRSNGIRWRILGGS